MKKLTVIIIVFLIFLSSSVSFAEGESTILGVSPALIESAMNGKYLILQRKYEEAYALYQKLETEYPDSATGLFGQMAIWQVRMFENEDYRFKSQYIEAAKRYENFARRHLKEGDVPSWDLFVYGAADGMRGFFAVREGSYVQALSHALHAIRMMKRLKWREPDFVDVDLGFGSYKYWRSVLTNRLKFLPFFSDQRKEGIAMVNEVVKKGKYSSDLAMANLIFIYENEGDYNNAINMADQILAKYPKNIIVRFLKAKIKIAQKKYDEALALFDAIYATDNAISKVILNKGMIYYRKKDYLQARRELELYLTKENEKYWRAVAYYQLGLTAEAGGDKQTAITNYEKSLELHKIGDAKTRLEKLK